jgi:hypothetical protein
MPSEKGRSSALSEDLRRALIPEHHHQRITRSAAQFIPANQSTIDSRWRTRPSGPRAAVIRERMFVSMALPSLSRDGPESAEVRA